MRNKHAVIMLHIMLITGVIFLIMIDGPIIVLTFVNCYKTHFQKCKADMKICFLKKATQKQLIKFNLYVL